MRSGSYIRFIGTLTILFFAFLTSEAQITKIMGIVSDQDTGEPIPFANVYFIGTTVGVTSDFVGEFSIETLTPSDTLVASFMGYETQFITIRKGQFQHVEFKLKSQNLNLPEVVIRAGENPAEILLRKIIANKKVNKNGDYQACQYEVYSKIEIDANNISDKFKERRLMRPFKFIFDYVDTSAVNGKTYLPIFLSETLSDYYTRKQPKAEKEVIKAAKVSGVENESILQFLGNTFQQYNFYDNYISIFQKNFVSPVANFGLNHYRYYLVDSTFLSDKWCYKIMFKPGESKLLLSPGIFG